MAYSQRSQRLVDFLSFLPSLESVARFAVLDYLSDFGPISSTIWHLNNNHSLILLASYGKADHSFAPSVKASNSITWSEENTQVTINLYVQSLLIGFLSFVFTEPVDNVEDFTLYAEEFSWQISLYLALRFQQSIGLIGVNGKVPKVSEAELTARQVFVLARIVAKKTNHEIAKELGFSTSTIRHETMRIFKTLGVSNREEAALQAQILGLL